MLEKIFDINHSNIFQDEDNYYFFRALEEVDLESIEKGTIIDENGNITKLITDREFYGDSSKYDEDSEISLDEMAYHIKIGYDKNTNCISFTTNANIASIYGRETYDDQYIIIKVPKSELNKTIYQAGLYMLQEVEKRLEKIIETKELTDMQKHLLSLIDNVTTEEELDKLKEMLPKEYATSRDLYDGGLEIDLTNTARYYSLTDEQNFEKDKIVMKIDILNEQLLSKISNKFLIGTIGGAFSSTEIIHYKDVPGNYINVVDPEFMDILGLVQQLPDGVEQVNELKQDLMSLLGRISIDRGFDYNNYQLDNKKLSFDDIYDITQGRYNYGEVQNLYHKLFYLAKAKLRTRNSVALLKNIFPDGKYDELFNYMLENTYGIEPEITNRRSKGVFQISESVSLVLNNSDEPLLDFINSLNTHELEEVLKDPRLYLEELLEMLPSEDIKLSKEDWFANSIIDSVDFKRLKVKEKLSVRQRNDIVKALKSHNFLDVYENLDSQGLTETEIADKLFTALIREKEISELGEKEKFNLEELEWFVGYNRIKGSGINLRDYQVDTLENIDRIFEDKQFASAILPTGVGKSYVALAKMLENPNQKILYLAPNVEILNQLTTLIIETLTPEEHFGDDEEKIIKRVFPNLLLDTYQHLKKESAEKIINDNYDLIVFDELHRTGAIEWKKKVEDLLNNQNEKVKVLGITATPERDVDLRDMTDHWAQYYGYSDEDIIKGKHLAKNMTIVDAIRMGIIANPKVVNCEYSLISDGSLDELKMNIDNIKSDDVRNQDLMRYENLRRQVESSDGIEEILNTYLKEDGKYIVFLPVIKKADGTFEDEDGNAISSSDASKRIKDYQTLIKQYLYSHEYLQSRGNQVLNIYDKISNHEELTEEEKKYLEEEKEQILLLTKIDIYGKPNALNTKTNLLAESIIEYMNWEKNPITETTHKLNKLMEDEVENYSMLGSYSDAKNRNQLREFSEEKNGKKKLMFVMNKLNEGVHVKDIDGIIWLRPLNTDSRILYQQQLGRCISALNPNEEINEEDRPLVLDLVNNTLKVNLERGTSQEEKDLMKLLLIESWIKKNQKNPEDITDPKEKELMVDLKRIQTRYLKYVDDEELIQDNNVMTKLLIKEIIEHGSNIDLWSLNLSEVEYNPKESDLKEVFLEEGILSLNPLLREFVDLRETVNNELDNVIAHLKAIEKYCVHNLWPDVNDVTTVVDGYTGSQLASWLYHSGFDTGDFIYKDLVYEGKNVKAVLDDLWETYGYVKVNSDEYVILHVKEIEEYCKNHGEWPKRDEHDLEASLYTGNQLSRWLDYHNYSYNNKKFDYIGVTYNGIDVKVILDSLWEKYKYKRKTRENVEERIQAIIDYYEEHKKWPARNEMKLKANGYTGHELNSWLHDHHYRYDNDNFDYSDREYKGRNMKDILDELWRKSNQAIQGSEEEIIKHIKEMMSFCPKFGWPKQKSENKVKNYTSSQLSGWLDRSKYNYLTDDFKYSKIIYDGRSIKDILDELWVQYGEAKEGSYESVINYVRAIEKMCEECNCEAKEKWPRNRQEETKDKVKITTVNNYSNTLSRVKDDKLKIYEFTEKSLADWLNRSGYYEEDFKYKGIKYNGEEVLKILEDLNEKYPYEKRGSPKYVRTYIKEIVLYCKYKKWPKSKSKEKVGKFTGNQLAQWLVTSGYKKGKFKYSNVEYKGKSVKDILDTLHVYYKQKAKEEYDNVKTIFDMYSEFFEVEEMIDNKEVTDGKQI